ncbi:MAG: ATP-binding protein [Planctomycetota bacterium]
MTPPLGPGSDRQAMLSQVSQLYELALAIGQSLDLTRNCAGFLERLMARRNLSYAAVWLRTESENAGYRLAYSEPAGEYAGPQVLPASAMHEELGQHRFLCGTADQILATRWGGEAPLPRGDSFTIASLADVGFLVLGGKGNRALWQPWQLSQISPILLSFARSISACLAHERLQQEIEVRRAAEQLANDANRAKSEFLANMSHEIRTPMTAIVGYAEILTDSNESDQRRRQAAETIQRNGTHLVAIINDILDISRLESRNFTIESHGVSIPGLLTDVRDLMDALALSKKVDLRVSCERVPECIETDPIRLRQILYNLVSNAMKFAAGGRVLLRCRCSADRRQLEFSVTDNGIGMTPDQVARIFQPFVQADASTTRKYGGTGLGLAISQRLAQFLGGSLSVESELGKGSEFTLSIALRPETAAAWVEPGEIGGRNDAPQTANEGPTPSPSATARILYVDDGVDNQRLVSYFLEKAGHRVTLRGNGQEGIQEMLRARASGADYDLLLMDMQMPVMDGYAATRELRRLGFDLPIIALTANAMSTDRIKCIDAGCDDFVTKPIDRRTLLVVIAERLSAELA